VGAIQLWAIDLLNLMRQRPSGGGTRLPRADVRNFGRLSARSSILRQVVHVRRDTRRWCLGGSRGTAHAGTGSPVRLVCGSWCVVRADAGATKGPTSADSGHTGRRISAL